MDIARILPQFKQMTIFDFIEDKDKAIVDGLGERQKLVYNTLKTYKTGATAKELSVRLHSDGKVMSNERNSVHPRLNELIAEGFVETVGKKTCQFTDRKVTIYKAITNLNKKK